MKLIKKKMTKAGTHSRNTSGLRPFKKGDPRINRKGAPKKVVRLQRLLEEVLGIPADSIEDGAKIRASDIGLIMEAVIKKAKRGDISAVRELLDRMYGRTKQEIELGGELKTAPVQVPAINVYTGTPPLNDNEDNVKTDKVV